MLIRFKYLQSDMLVKYYLYSYILYGIHCSSRHRFGHIQIHLTYFSAICSPIKSVSVFIVLFQGLGSQVCSV